MEKWRLSVTVMEREVEGRRETDEKVDEDSLNEDASWEVGCLWICESRNCPKRMKDGCTDQMRSAQSLEDL